MSATAPTIGIDARKITDFGIGRHLEGLLEGLARLGGDERYVLFLAEGDRGELPGALEATLDHVRFRRETCRAPLYSLRELFAFRGAAARHGLDLLHFPHYVRAFAPGCPVSATIHDAIHLSHPPSWRARLYARLVMGWTAHTADALFTVSRSARDDIARRLDVSPSRFRVVPNAVAPRFRPPDPARVAEFRRTRVLPADFVLVIASHRPHKNLAGAIEGFRRASLPGAVLVVPARDEEAARSLRPFETQDRVHLLRPVADDELPLLYAAARLVLAPSLAEGFGLPPLEAAACGAAVLATGIAPHREVMGDAAAFAPTGAPDDLAAALAELWGDDARLAALRECGPRQAARYDWLECARLTREGWRAALARANG